MRTKECTLCHKEKSLSAFYYDKRAKSGCYSSCRRCHNKSYPKLTVNKVTVIKGWKKWRRTHPMIIKTYSLFQKALRTKEIVRPNNCSECGKKCKPEGHHEDYSKPLQVMWLCKKCHENLHHQLD